jgi:ubiquinone biosynthesis protein Coq4
MAISIDEQDAQYLMGVGRPRTSSILVSDSPYLNNPRVRDIFAQMGLKRNGIDLPDAYLVPEVNRALAEETDMERLHQLIVQERHRTPEFAEWLDARFVSDWGNTDLSNCAEGSVGAAIRTFMEDSGLDIDFMFRGEPANDFMYLVKRRVQNHDIEHIITGLDPSPVGEIALIVANTVACFNYFSPELAQMLSFQPMFLASTSLMRMACHYPAVTPAMLEGFALGQAVGAKQDKPFFMIRWEDWIDVPIHEARRHFRFEDGPPAGHWAWTFEAAKG